jgi:hypothetical protein
MPIGTSLAPYLALKEGEPVTGELVDFRVQQKSDYDTNRPLYFCRNTDGKASRGFDPYADDGRPNEPICDWIFTLDVGEEDENGETERRIFIDPRKGAKGSAVEGKRGRDAIEIALKKAKAHRIGLEIGARITLERGPKVAPKRGDAACVTFSAEYEPPPGGVGAGTPVDDVPWLIGGGRYDPSAREVVDTRPGADRDADRIWREPRPTAPAVGAGGSAAVDEDPPF